MIIRQGDVMLVKVPKIPNGCVEVPGQERKIVLAWGEQTGHHHRIEDHINVDWSGAGKIADAAIGLAGRRARLLQATNGTRYLEVAETVNLTHEEHTAHAIPPGYYELPQQMEHSAERMRRVVD